MPQPPQSQNVKMSSDVIVVKTEQEVIDCPIGPGNSVIFKIDGKPELYIKTMGISQFDSPTIEKWVKDEKDTKKDISEIKNDEIAELRSYVDALKEEVADLRDKVLFNKTPKRTVKEVDKND